MKYLLTLVVLFACLAVTPAKFVQEPIAVSASGVTLHGTVMLPHGKGIFPIALIVAGSGAIDRDGNAPPAEVSDAYFKLAKDLAARGIASLRYDKRGVGASVSARSMSDLRFEDYTNDASAIVDALAKDPRWSSITIIGHSEGSLLAILVAERNAHVAKVVSLAGAGRDIADILDEQMKAQPMPQSVIDLTLSYDATLRKGQLIPSLDPSLAATSPNLAMLYRSSAQPYLISWMKYDPASEIAKVAQPVLILQGTNDLQVGAADARALAAAQPKARLVLVDGMNHMLVAAPLDRAANFATYSQPALPLVPALVDAIVTFING